MTDPRRIRILYRTGWACVALVGTTDNPYVVKSIWRWKREWVRT